VTTPQNVFDFVTPLTDFCSYNNISFSPESSQARIDIV